MSTGILRTLLAAVLLCAAAASAADEKHPRGISSRTVTKEGTRMDIRMESVADQNASVFHEGDDLRIRVHLEETTGGTPIRKANPAAWLDLADENAAPAGCATRIQHNLEGSTFQHAALDLTSHLIAVMNDDATIAIVDPRFGYGDTRLIAMIDLPSPAEDWVADSTGDHLYATLPASHQVAVIDTAAWKVSALVNAGSAPTRILLQPDGAYLWVGDDRAGVVAIRTADRAIAATLATAPGPHQMAISSNNSFLFVTNSEAGSVSVVDTRKLAKVKDVPAGKSPGAVAYSPLAQAAYVASSADGVVTAIGGKDFSAIAKLTVDPGVGHMRFEPGGRYALALNTKTDKLYVFDASTNHLVQTAHTERAPNQLAFSNKLVFIRHAGSDTVLMIPFDSLGRSEPISAADVTGGNRPPGEMPRLAAADGIVQASSEDAVIIANPGDRAVYFYMEGMAAPMGSFADFGKSPRAVMVVERNLRERTPGEYETVARLPGAGHFEIAFFVDRPRVLQCIQFTVERSPGAPDAVPLPRIELLPPPSQAAGKPVEVRLRVLQAAGRKPIDNLADVVILLVGPGAVWQSRQVAARVGEGVYSASFQPSDAGTYLVYIAAPAEGVDFQQYGTVRVDE